MFSHLALISVELANSFWPRKLSAAPIGVFFQCEALFEACVEHFVLRLQIVDEQETVGFPRRLLIQPAQLLLRRAELLNDGVQLVLVAQPPRKRALPGRRVSFGVVCGVYFLFLGAGGESASGGAKGEGGRVSFGVARCLLLRGMEASQLPGGEGGMVGVVVVYFLFWGAGGESASGAAKGEGGESALGETVAVVACFFLGGGRVSFRVGCVVFCGEWRRVSFRGCEGGMETSQLWSCVCCRLLFFGGESASRGCVGDGGASQLWSCVCVVVFFFSGASQLPGGA